jgi:3-oxoadipate enol-lactonase
LSLAAFRPFQMAANYFNTPDGGLFYTKEGSGPPLIFVHGFCLDHRMWDYQVKFFSADYSVVAVDLRGFGKSAPPTDKPFSYHEDLAGLLDHWNIKQPVILVGHSMGGRAVANFALSYPDKTKAIVFADAAIDGYKFNDFDLAYIYRTGKELGIPAANKIWLDHPLFDPARLHPATSGQLSEIIKSYSGWHWINKNPVRNLTPPAFEQLESIKLPTLIIVGQQDLPDFISIAEILNQRIDKSIIKQIPGAGHMCNMEEPEVFNNLLSQFLSSLR